ncbi:MAG: hypothetical protein FWC00_02260 [Firmicutes bacterium]|nr:hypothetical protein [Bacillota bacterium]
MEVEQIEPPQPPLGFANELGNFVLTYIFPFILLAAVFWAVWVGVQFLLAKDQNLRIAAKKRLITAVATVMVFVTITSLLIGMHLITTRPTIPPGDEGGGTIGGGGGGGGGGQTGGGGWSPPGGGGLGQDRPLGNPLGGMPSNFRNPVQMPGMIMGPGGYDIADPTHPNFVRNLLAETQIPLFHTKPQSPGHNVMFARELTAVYGWRRINTPTIIRANEERVLFNDAYNPAVSSTYPHAASRFSFVPAVPGTDVGPSVGRPNPLGSKALLSAFEGLGEDFFGLEINVGQGEGLAVTNLQSLMAPPYFPLRYTGPNLRIKTEALRLGGARDPISVTSSRMLYSITAGTILYGGLGSAVLTGDDRALTPGTRSRAVRNRRPFNEAVLPLDMVGLDMARQALTPVHADWPNRHTSARAVAIADGTVVAAGNIETDCPFTEAYVILRHEPRDTGLPYVTYSFYGGLFGSLRVRCLETINAYNTFQTPRFAVELVTILQYYHIPPVYPSVVPTVSPVPISIEWPFEIDRRIPRTPVGPGGCLGARISSFIPFGVDFPEPVPGLIYFRPMLPFPPPIYLPPYVLPILPPTSVLGFPPMVPPLPGMTTPQVFCDGCEGVSNHPGVIKNGTLFSGNIPGASAFIQDVPWTTGPMLQPNIGNLEYWLPTTIFNPTWSPFVDDVLGGIVASFMSGIDDILESMLENMPAFAPLLSLMGGISTATEIAQTVAEAAETLEMMIPAELIGEAFEEYLPFTQLIPYRVTYQRGQVQKLVDELVETGMWRVSRGDHIGFVGGGMLDPGAGQRRGPVTFPGGLTLEDIIAEIPAAVRTAVEAYATFLNLIVDILTLPVQIVRFALTAVVTTINALSALFGSVVPIPDIPEVPPDVVDKVAPPIERPFPPGYDPVEYLIREYILGDMINQAQVFHGYNYSTERHLRFMIMHDAPPAVINRALDRDAWAHDPNPDEPLIPIPEVPNLDVLGAADLLSAVRGDAQKVNNPLVCPRLSHAHLRHSWQLVPGPIRALPFLRANMFLMPSQGNPGTAVNPLRYFALLTPPESIENPANLARANNMFTTQSNPCLDTLPANRFQHIPDNFNPQVTEPLGDYGEPIRPPSTTVGMSWSPYIDSPFARATASSAILGFNASSVALDPNVMEPPRGPQMFGALGSHDSGVVIGTTLDPCCGLVVRTDVMGNEVQERTQEPRPPSFAQRVRNEPFAGQLRLVFVELMLPFLLIGGIFYAIMVGIQFGTAKDEGSRNAAKQRLIKSIATIFIFVIILAIMYGLPEEFTSPPLNCGCADCSNPAQRDGPGSGIPNDEACWGVEPGAPEGTPPRCRCPVDLGGGRPPATTPPVPPT